MYVQEDNAPLNIGEVVQLEIEIFPAAGKVHEGWKLRMDVSIGRILGSTTRKSTWLEKKMCPLPLLSFLPPTI